MSEGGEGRSAFSHRAAGIGIAVLFLLLGAIVVYDSVRLGARWVEDGPQAGYFPFYIGLIVCISSAVNLAVAVARRRDAEETFVETGQLKLVLAVLVPSLVYVALVTWVGIYAASAVFIAFFMRWLGKYPWWKVAAVSIGNSVVFFLIFEVWFKVPLPKGPLENWLGIG